MLGKPGLNTRNGRGVNKSNAQSHQDAIADVNTRERLSQAGAQKSNRYKPHPNHANDTRAPAVGQHAAQGAQDKIDQATKSKDP